MGTEKAVYPAVFELLVEHGLFLHLKHPRPFYILSSGFMKNLEGVKI